LLNRVDELYFNDYECPESEVDSDVENFKSNNEVDYVEHFVEPSVDDTREYIAQARFRNDTCGCKEFYGEPCSQIIDVDAAIEFQCQYKGGQIRSNFRIQLLDWFTLQFVHLLVEQIF
jgi:hypothetical protein